jgi:hypothetical protein
MRLYRENIALKAQLEALERHLARVETKRNRVSLGVRAAQVLAYLLTRGDEPFQRYFLSAPRTTIMGWAMRFRSLRRHTLSGGRPPLDDTIVELIVTLREPRLGPAAHGRNPRCHRQGYVIQAPGSPFVPVDWRCNPSGCLWPFAHPCRGPLDSFLSRRIPSACDYEPSPWSY